MTVALLIEYKGNSAPAQCVPIATQSDFVRLWKPMLLREQRRAVVPVAAGIVIMLNAETGGPVALLEVPMLLAALERLRGLVAECNHAVEAREAMQGRITLISSALLSINIAQVASIWMG